MNFTRKQLEIAYLTGDTKTAFEALAYLLDSLPPDKWETPKEWVWHVLDDENVRQGNGGTKGISYFPTRQHAESAAKRRKRLDKLQQYINAHWPEHDVSGAGYYMFISSINEKWDYEGTPNIAGFHVTAPTEKAAQQVCDALNSGELDLGD